MAPQVSLADDIERLSLCVAQLARVALSGKLQLSQLGKPAAAAGLSVTEVAAWVRGEIALPSRQSVALVSAVLEQQRARQVGYMEVLKAGHAGSDAPSASYVATVTEKVTLPRGRTEDVTNLRGGPPEGSAAEAAATVARLVADFPAWEVPAPDGVASLGTDRPKLVWLAHHPDHGRISGASSFELARKLLQYEAGDADRARRWKQFTRG
jgi:hypothetical protein